MAQVQDPELGMTEPGLQQDVSPEAVAKDLQEKGFSREQVQSMADTLPLVPDTITDVLSFFPEAAPEAPQEEIVQEEVQPELPGPFVPQEAVQGRSANAVTDFFDDSNTDFFSEENTVRALRSTESGERATMTGILMSGGFTEEANQLIPRIKMNLESYGSDSDYGSTQLNVVQSVKVPFLDAVLEEAPTDETLPAFSADMNVELNAIETQNPIGMMVASTLEALPPESRKYDFVFNDIVNESLTKRAASSVIDQAMKDDWDEASTTGVILDWAEVLFGGQLITSRAFNAEVLEKMNLEGGAEDYVFKTEHLDLITDYVRNSSSNEEFLERVEEIVTAVTDSESPFGDNTVFTATLLSNLRSEIDQRNTGKVAAVFEDVFDVFELGVVLKHFGAKMLGSIGAANKTLSETDAQAIKEVMKNAADTASPSVVKPRVRVTPEGTPLVNRTAQGSLLDSLSVTHPSVIKNVMKTTEDKEAVATYLGNTKQEVAERMIPLGTGESGTHYALVQTPRTVLDDLSEYDSSALQGVREDFDRLNQQHTLSSVLKEDELSDGFEKEVRRVHEMSAGTLHPQGSWTALDMQNDIITGRVTFGASEEGGYGTLQAAEDARLNLFSDEGESIIVARPKGSNSNYDFPETFPENVDLEYFVQANVKHQVTSRDVNPFAGTVDGFSTVQDYLMPFGNRIDKDITTSQLAYTDKSSRIAQTMQQFTTPIGKLRGRKEREQWTRLLMHGDAKEMTFNRAQAAEFLGGSISDRVWDAYVGSRSFYDAMAITRNKSVRAELTEQGFKSVRSGGKHLEDERGKVFVQPRADRPLAASLEADTIFDTKLGQAVRVSDEVLQEAYDNGMIVGRTSRPVRQSGEEWDNVLIPRADVVDLDHLVLPYRRGHLDINYLGEDTLFQRFIGRVGGSSHKGGTGAMLQRQVTKTRNGRTYDEFENVGVYRDEVQAGKALTSLRQSDDEVWRVQSTRETTSALGINEAGTLSNVPSHARGRGKRLLGPDGYAELETVEDSIGRALGEARRFSGIDGINILKNKFLSGYMKHIKNRDIGFVDDFARYEWTDAKNFDIQTKIKEAEKFHRYVRNQENALSGNLRTKFLSDLSAQVRAWKQDKGFLGERAGTFMADILDKDWVKAGTQLNVGLFIASRVLYQTLANSAQSLYLLAQSPVQFFRRTVPGTVTALSALIPAVRKNAAAMKVLGKVNGMSGEQYGKYIQDMLDSGIFSTAAVDDIMGMLQDGMKVEAGRNSLASGAFWRSMTPGGGLGSRAASAAMLPQRIATDFSNLLAYVHSTATFKAKNPNRGFDTLYARREIQAEARRLTFTQNRADQFAYQQNALNIQLQFMQHVHKMYMNLVLDPAVTVATGGKASVLRKGTNPWAGTFAQSATTLAMTTSMFGTGTWIAGGAEGSLTELMNEAGVSEEAQDWFMDGYLGAITESIFGEELNLTSRFSPNDFVQSSLSLMFTDEGALNLGGPMGSTWKSMNNLYSLAKSFHSTGSLTEEDAIKLLGNEAKRMLAGLRDADAARVAQNMNLYVTSSGRPVAEVAEGSAVPLLFSVAPSKTEDYFDSLDDLMAARDHTDRVVQAVSRSYLNELSQKHKDAWTGLEIVEVINKHVRLIEMSFPVETQRQAAKEAFARDLLDPQKPFITEWAQKLITTLNPEQSRSHLTQMKQRYPEQAAGIDILLETLDGVSESDQD